MLELIFVPLDRRIMENLSKIYYVMGVSGSGKSTIGRALANHLSLPYLEADDFHPAANIDKMSNGEALNDIDRAPWLKAIKRAALEEAHNKGAVVSCSALKQKYRDQLEEGLKNFALWIYLDGSFDLIYDRMKNRNEHFMPDSLLRSQFDALEIPQKAVRVDISETTEDVLQKLFKRIV